MPGGGDRGYSEGRRSGARDRRRVHRRGHRILLAGGLEGERRAPRVRPLGGAGGAGRAPGTSGMNPADALERIRFLPEVIRWLEETQRGGKVPAPESDWLAAAQALLDEALAGKEAQFAAGRHLPELASL